MSLKHVVHAQAAQRAASYSMAAQAAQRAAYSMAIMDLIYTLRERPADPQKQTISISLMLSAHQLALPL